VTKVVPHFADLDTVGGMHEAWRNASGDVQFRRARWSGGNGRSRGELWVTADGFNWKKGAVIIPWEIVTVFDVLRVGPGNTDSAGGRSMFSTPMTRPPSWNAAIDAVSGRYPEARSRLVVETEQGVELFTTAATYDNVVEALRPTIIHFSIRH
jgi:hypothetical protein